MRAYVQQVNESTRNFMQLFQAAHWFGERGYEIIRFRFEGLERGELDDDLRHHPDEMVLRGGVEAVRAALVRAGRPLPPNLDLPLCLQRWFGRRVWESTMGDVRRVVGQPGQEPLHVKPLRHHKLFTGRVVREFRDLISTAAVPDETPILVQEYVRFVTEWRATILRDRVLNVAHYRGDPLTFPDAEIVRQSVRDFVGRPVGFAMDWGVTGEGQTLLVEVNDGYSLGNYGVRGPAFTALIEARWRELMGLPDNGIDAVEQD
jgi:hypothetical protein